MYSFYVCIVHTHIHTEYQDHDATAIRDATTNKADRSKKMNTTIDRRAEKASDRAHILLSDTANTNIMKINFQLLYRLIVLFS